MNRFFAVLALLALYGIPPQNAWASPPTCGETLNYLEWTQKYFDSADAVFLGEVLAEEAPDPPERPQASVEPAASMTELLERIEAVGAKGTPAPRLQKVTLEAQKAWKGSPGNIIELRSSLYRTDYGTFPIFRKGERYLVFAYRDDDGTLFVPISCASPHPDKETADRIRVLDALTRKPGGS